MVEKKRSACLEKRTRWVAWLALWAPSADSVSYEPVALDYQVGPSKEFICFSTEDQRKGIPSCKFFFVDKKHIIYFSIFYILLC